MKSIKRSVNVPTLFLVALLSALIAHQATGNRTAVANPTVVVTVNIGEVMEGLNERAEAYTKLRAMSDENKMELEKLETDLKNMQAQYEASTIESEKKVLLNQLVNLNLQAQHYNQYAMDKQDIEMDIFFQRIYSNIKAAIEQMADTEGYDVVLIDDTEFRYTANPNVRVSRADQIKQWISNRRIIYARPSVDITQDLIVRMNNAHNAG